MKKIRELIEAARTEASHLDQLATAADDRGAQLIIERAEKLRSLADDAEEEARESEALGVS